MDNDAFTIERHALKVTQPVEVFNGTHRLNCPRSGGRRWGRIDFSKGFSEWWFLSHMDIKVPSEHLQEGKQYSGEIQLAHFYSVPGEIAGVDNEVRDTHDDVRALFASNAYILLLLSSSMLDGTHFHVYGSL